ncbi:Inner membrane protein yebE [Oligella ureolytica]|uniref:Inner membrane protein yebE n=1 Tax=Oligella ureolytica TaxID=90244 RepID=A0A378XDQ9_9BURK|nr:DUF533 domain-containing protein [Oligella ureolytica]QPT40527.1 tellurite resistance TerB family protein [Oligella ureolytica]SUA51405.1 Inner membrane protein yebE [Oligella ureolytica]
MSAINILQRILGNIGSNTSNSGNSGNQGGLGNLGGGLGGSLGGIAGNILGQIKDNFGREDTGSSQSGSKILSKNDQMALGAGALAVLLGRRNDSDLVQMGGLAALGTVAFRAYQRWQSQQQNAVDIAHAGPWFANTAEGQDIRQLDEATQEQSSRALIAAIILAARADGHVDAEEQAFIEEQTQHVATAEERAWMGRLFNGPVDPSEVSKYVDSPAMASQVYALSLAVLTEPNFMERSYLDELARQLSITEELKQELQQELQKQVA